MRMCPDENTYLAIESNRMGALETFHDDDDSFLFSGHLKDKHFYRHVIETDEICKSDHHPNSTVVLSTSLVQD